MPGGSGGVPRLVAESAATRENRPVGNLEGRPPRERLVCVDCGRDLDPAEALEIHLGKMKVCPTCMGALRAVTGDVLGYGPIGRLPRTKSPNPGAAGLVPPDSLTQLDPDPEFVSICRQMVEQGWTDADWAERESSDCFQTQNFCRGYDADEGAFCFSYYDASGNEWWFQVSLAEAQTISAGERLVIALRPAE
jgi:hypothetical protein